VSPLGSDELVVVLEVNDNAIFNAKEGNDEGASFWLILCIKPLHKVRTPFINKWLVIMRRVLMSLEVYIIRGGEIMTTFMSYLRIHKKSMSILI
jgi:hypothetical protein